MFPCKSASSALPVDVDGAAGPNACSPPLATLPLSGAHGPPSTARPAQGPSPRIPNELLRQVASHLELTEAKVLRQCSASCFAIVAETHREALAAELRQAVVSPVPHRPRPALAAMRHVLADAREVRSPINAWLYDKHHTTALDEVVHESLGKLLTYSPKATTVELPLGTPVLLRFAERALRLPPAVDTLRLDQLCCPARVSERPPLDLPAFFWANADREVRTLMLARSSGRALGDPRAFDRPLFPWPLSCLELFDVELNEADFARLLRNDFDALETLVLAEAPDAARHSAPFGSSVQPGQLKDLCALPLAKLRRLELFGDFSSLEVRAFARRAWPSLEVLRLRGEQLTNDDAERLAHLRAPKLRQLTLEAPVDLYALVSLLHPAHAPLRELAIFFTQTGRGWRQKRIAPPTTFAEADQPSPVRYLRLSQGSDFLPGDAERLVQALSPAAPMVRELELHTCVANHGGHVRRALPQVLGQAGLGERAGPDALSLTYCKAFGSAD